MTKNKTQCAEFKMPENTTCDCNYVRPTIEKIEMRYNKKGELQVRLNGKGKWYHAELNGTTLSFHA